MIDPQIEGKVVLITGANHGIGAAAARAFAVQGARGYLTYFRETCEYTSAQLKDAGESGVGGVLLYRANQQQATDSIIQELRTFGATTVAEELDLSVAENIPALFDRCENELGPVDILVNNHTYCAPDTLPRMRKLLSPRKRHCAELGSRKMWLTLYSFLHLNRPIG